MGSKGRVSHLRRPISGPVLFRGGLYGSGPGVRPPPPHGAMLPFEMLPPPELMEQKLAVQHEEMQKLATENQRLASTHAPLREELASAQNDLQMLHAHVGAVRSERDMQMRGLIDKIAKMETELKASEPVKSELQKARAEAEQLVAIRQELMSKVHQLNQDLHKARLEVQQIPALMSELENLRQEDQRCRVSYEYEKKLFNDHLESLQVMENNYATMTREVERLRSHLNSASTVDRAGVPFDAVAGVSGKQVSAHPPMYEEDYNVQQVQGHFTLPGNAANAAPASNTIIGVGPPHVGPQVGSASRPTFDPSKAATYDPTRGHGYDLPREPAHGYDVQTGHGLSAHAQVVPGFEVHRVPPYDAQRVNAPFDQQKQSAHDSRGYGYDPPPGFAYDPSSPASYNPMPRGPTLPQTSLMPSAAAPYGSATPSRLVGAVYEAPHPGGVNSTRK